ncbi:MAG TPA: protein kinase [Blastocatellia bacterium]|nr:protein kinase [Blastocatellia bacterium]
MSSPIHASGTSPALAKQSPCEDQPNVQATLDRRFNLLKFLGTSGNSYYFAAHDLAADRPVRLKVLSDEAAVDREQRELFYLEAAASAKLSHQNITRTTEAEELGGTHFCTIEQSPSAISLRDLLDIRSWLEVDVAVTIALQLTDALDYAHGLGVLHLKLDPANVLIESDGRVLVTDFGIGGDEGLAWAQADRSGRHCVQYASPEQIQGSSLDCRSDLYSLGIILFEMLTDRVPFDSTDAGVVKRKQLTQSAYAPQLFRQGISNYLSALVLTLLEKNPDWRFRTAAQLQTALGKVAAPAESLPVEVESQGAELDSIDDSIESQADPDAGAEYISAWPEDEAEAADDPVNHREFFEPPTIIKIDPPPREPSEPKARAKLSPPVPVAREDAEPLRLYVSSDKSQSRKQRLVFLAIMLAILLLISLLGRNHLPGFFLAASAVEQYNLPDANAQTPVTDPEPASAETVPAGPVEHSNQTGSSAVSPPAQVKAAPPRRRYVRRAAFRRAGQPARRKLRVKRKVRRPLYLRRDRTSALMFDVGEWGKARQS